MNLHFIAVGGAIMHQLAIVSHQKGFRVSGSDDEIADPAKSNLLNEGLLPSEIGWFPEKITSNLDAVILGMHAREDNPELKRAQELNIPIYSFPEYIYEMSKNKLRIVIAGSHGKTTTTSMLMHVLKDHNFEFDYLVGAKVAGFKNSVKISNAPVIIIEGDEYPASILEKRPKIHFYYPQIAVLTGIAWDHVNVFPTYDNYWSQFKIFLEKMTAGNTLIYNAEDKEVVRLIETEDNRLKVIPYSTPTYQIKNNIVSLQATEGMIPLQIFGNHNLQNMEAARKVSNLLEISDYSFYNSMMNFTGAAKRLEKTKVSEELIVFRDFAHAPSKLKASLNAVRNQYASHYLIACFELHTFSSLSPSYIAQYAQSMDNCDSGALFYSEEALSLKKLPDLDEQLLKSNFVNPDLAVFNQKKILRQWIEHQINSSKKPVCLLLMSSGTFDGMNIEF